MDIKFTHTGAIPFNEFPEYHEFLVLRECDRAPLFVCKEDNSFRIIGTSDRISRFEVFTTWEPVSLTLPTDAVVTRKLWLSRPNLLSPRGWVFRLYENPRETVNVWIRDIEFNLDFFTKRKLSVSCGDVFEATMSRSSNGCGELEIYEICRIRNENEKFRKLLDEL